MASAILVAAAALRPIGAEVPLVDEVLQDAGVIELRVVHHARDPWRNQQRGHAHAKLVESVLHLVIVRSHGSGRRYMVVESAVLVEEERQQAAVP